jgi:hypothetical protein
MLLWIVRTYFSKVDLRSGVHGSLSLNLLGPPYIALIRSSNVSRIVLPSRQSRATLFLIVGSNFFKSHPYQYPYTFPVTSKPY